MDEYASIPPDGAVVTHGAKDYEYVTKSFWGAFHEKRGWYKRQDSYYNTRQGSPLRDQDLIDILDGLWQGPRNVPTSTMDRLASAEKSPARGEHQAKRQKASPPVVDAGKRLHYSKGGPIPKPGDKHPDGTLDMSWLTYEHEQQQEAIKIQRLLNGPGPAPALRLLHLAPEMEGTAEQYAARAHFGVFPHMVEERESARSDESIFATASAAPAPAMTSSAQDRWVGCSTAHAAPTTTTATATPSTAVPDNTDTECPE